ncbi:MAG TPA: sulfatase-like hydrolase/transferase [Pirellulales bacterium]|nr:sulfatase-like hydrolase/transferase [Pirellulales bacterium]
MLRVVLRRLAGAGLMAMISATLAADRSQAAEAENQRPPNILILIADDLGWNDIGYHGSQIRTPQFDRLAQGGVKLERHYVYPTCSPTRAGLFTGRNPSRFGIHAPIGGRSTDSLPLEAPTLARLLKSHGYETALAGKWHLGLRPAVGPRKFSFDQTYGYLHGQLDQLTHRYKNGDRTWHRNDVFIDEPGHATDLIADEAVRFITTKREAPFLLWTAFSVPHCPLQEEEKWTAPYQEAIGDASRRMFAASVAHMDAAIGRIIDALEQSGQLDDTLILFTSDNGGQRDHFSKTDYGGKHGPYPTLGDNRPLRGWKGELYEGGVRVPAFVYWRGKLQPGVVQETVSFLDWLPTLARLTGAKTDDTWQLEGRDVWPLLAGKAAGSALPALYWNTGSAVGVLDGDWKLIVSGRAEKKIELYNLADDPAEAKDLVAAEPEQVARLQKLLAAQQARDP